MSKTDSEIITSTRVMYYILIFYKYDSAYVVFPSGVYSWSKGSVYFSNWIFSWAGFHLTSTGHLFTTLIYLSLLFFFPRISLSVQYLKSLKSLPSGHCAFYCSSFLDGQGEICTLYILAFWLGSCSCSSRRRVISNILKFKHFIMCLDHRSCQGMYFITFISYGPSVLLELG